MKDSMVRFVEPNPTARLRLFCVPYAGGGTLVFHHWPQALSPDIEVCPIQLPGREHRLSESPFVRLEPLLRVLERDLYAHLDRPFAFFGHSLGALVVFELVRRFRDANAPEPEHLFVSGCRAPHLPDPDPPIHKLPQDAFIKELRRYNGTPEALFESPELMELFLPVLRADFAVFETYRHRNGEPLDCPITAFGGLQDKKVNQVEIVSWRDVTHNRFGLHMFAGDHFFLNVHRDALLQIISEELCQPVKG